MFFCMFICEDPAQVGVILGLRLKVGQVSKQCSNSSPYLVYICTSFAVNESTRYV